MSKDGKSAELLTVELGGAGGYEPGKEVRRVSRVITSAEWQNLKSFMDHWSLESEPEKLGLDGAEWIFETRTSKGYKAVRVWSPKSGPAHDAGRLFRSVAGIEVPPEEDY